MNLSYHSVLASVCRDSFLDFLQKFWGQIIHEDPVFNWHIEYLCNELQQVAERVFLSKEKAHDLIINIPPGSTKSTICSQMFPAWVWTRMPHAQFICASYAHQIALKDSIRTRDIVQSDLYQKCFPDIQLREDENTKGLFVNTKKGFRFSAGVGGAVTGYHGHFLIVDDPLNPEEAVSEAELKGVNRWMRETLPSRKMRFAENVVPTILIQQRLHQADPSGEILEKTKGRGIKHICLPGEVTEAISPPELAEKYQDGLLDPIRSSKTVLVEMRRDLGEYGYAAQILQSPVPLGGGMFKVERFIKEEHPPKRFLRKVRSWDKAGTELGGAFSVGVLMGIDTKNATWILDVIRGQWGSTKREEMIRHTAEVDGKDVHILLEIEGGSGGKESGENTVRNLAGFKVDVYHPTGDKEARAYPLSSQVGGGTVHLLNREWTREYLEELRFFPNSKYKDQVDASSGGFNWLVKKRIRIGGAW
jgi:predicted phage terminase large subunit-like protein